MHLKERFNKLCNTIGDKIEEGMERLVNSHTLKVMEDKVIGDDFMARAKKSYPLRPVPRDTHIPASERLCLCEPYIEGTVVDGIQYCALCNGVVSLIS